ncbi:MAG TPA: GNAT family N-acetyltransferase [Rhizobiaceae bacterium]|nr:GNAT family N-acetyltransferase [Rhizobiaceae bacterium]
MKHVLDRPIWSALTTRHKHLAEGGPAAVRFQPSISQFAATVDNSDTSLAELNALAAVGDNQIFLQVDDIELPRGFNATIRARAVQMLAEKHVAPFEYPRIQRLSTADAVDMLALATLTKPGPFTLRSQELGRFWGIKEGGQLIAMAGERLKQPGMTELSGVAVHPSQQGKGFGRLLSLYVAGQIFAAGEQPYLHAYATNAKAIALYESLGFRLRTEMNVAMAEKK